ncbi:preprotein translocase subunit YajC [Georgenia sp. H159]|uniref:preprotein translocase subunit YajC n=1 Tax=Georgenia sp. H159 TaxID=3076115 RepID=UPI002D7811FA|nr:preprotein translocase subunit YajC [Georgenia sp. H159]
MEFLILIAVFGLMMWMMSRGAKKQKQAAADLRASLDVGQQVMTASGFYGTIVDVDGDVITLESSPGIETLWKREAIASVTEPPFAVEDEEETDDDEVTGLAVPDDASSLTQHEQSTDPVVDEQVDRPTDENGERRA